MKAPMDYFEIVEFEQARAERRAEAEARRAQQRAAEARRPAAPTDLRPPRLVPADPDAHRRHAEYRRARRAYEQQCLARAAEYGQRSA